MSKFLLNTTELWHIANASLRIAVLLIVIALLFRLLLSLLYFFMEVGSWL